MAELALLLLTIFWGSTFLLTKRILATTSPGVFLSLRFGLAAVAMGIVWWLVHRRRPVRLTPGLWRDGTLLGLTMAGGFLLQTIGLRYTTAPRSGFLTGLTVLFVPLVARFGMKKPVAPATWIGVSLALVGLAVMTRPFDGSVTTAMRFGDTLTLGCAVAFAAHLVWTAEWSARHALPPLLLVQILVVLVGALVLAAFEPRQVGPAPDLIAVVVYTGLVMTAGAFFLQTWAQRHTTAVRAALIFALEPVFAALCVWLVGGERIPAAEWIGGAVIVAGVVFGEITPRGRAASAAR